MIDYFGNGYNLYDSTVLRLHEHMIVSRATQSRSNNHKDPNGSISRLNDILETILHMLSIIRKIPTSK